MSGNTVKPSTYPDSMQFLADLIQTVDEEPSDKEDMQMSRRGSWNN